MKYMIQDMIKTLLMYCVFSLSFSGIVNAENMKKMDNINVHYIAIGTTFLTPEIAKAYGIERSRYKALVNISVLDNTEKGNPAKTVVMTGTARNDVGQIKTLEFSEVKEGDAVYYLAEISYTNEETVYFDINIADKGRYHNFTFKQKFYVD